VCARFRSFLRVEPEPRNEGDAQLRKR
jgi:hypothetical protein